MRAAVKAGLMLHERCGLAFGVKPVSSAGLYASSRVTTGHKT